MKKRSWKILTLAVASLLAVSCAEKPKDDMDGIEQMSLDAWMAAYGSPEAQKRPSGMYVETLTEATDPAALTAEKDSWIQLNYTGMLLDGSVYVSRSEEVARLEGTFSRRVHYVPQLLQVTESSYFLNKGQYEGLLGMKEGEKTRLYLPPALAYGSSGTSISDGYQGQQSWVPANRPIMVDMELVRVLDDPTEYENKQVDEYAAANWHMAVNDTIKPHFFLDIYSSDVYGDAITKDSTTSIYYVASFLDGFVLDTNIDSVALRAFGSELTDAEALSYTPVDGDLITAFYEAVTRMKYGDRARMVFTSLYGYGTDGNYSGSTQVDPYTPLVYDFYIEPNKGNGTEEYPFTTAKVLDMKREFDDVWVWGYITGTVTSPISEQNAHYESPFQTQANVMIASFPNNKEFDQMVIVELPEGDIRNNVNLITNPTKHKRRLQVKGDIRFLESGNPVITNVTDYAF